MIDFKMNVTANYRKHQQATKKILISQGGGRSGKTFAIIQIIIIAALQKKQLISIVAENVPFLKRGAIRDFKAVLSDTPLWDESWWNKTDSIYSFPNGSQIEFFAADNPGKALGSARDMLFINEANNISYEIAFQLMARTTGRVFIDFNPRSEFWAHTEILQNKAYEGQVDLVHSTFEDNNLLSDSIKETMLARGLKDANYKKVYIDGEIGTNEGLVFDRFVLVDELPTPTRVHGMDFGYTQDPTSLVGVLIEGDKLYLDEELYQTGMRNSDIVNFMKSENITGTIYADSAEPKTIDDIYLAGFNIHPTTKGKDSIMWGVDLMRQYEIHITKRSLNLIKEFRNYTFAKDKEGKALNQPIDAWNHGIDASRYAVMMLQRNRHEYRELNTFDNTRRL